MIDIKTLHQLYIAETTHKIEALEKELQIILKRTKIVESRLELHRDNINFYVNVKLDTILSNINPALEKSIVYPITKIYNDGAEINFESIKLYINTYIQLKCNTNTLNNDIKRLKKKRLPFKIYETVIKKCNNKIADRIVTENYIFSPNSHFGELLVIKTNNEKKRINWGASNKNKAKLLEQGLIPYKKADAESQENYQGVKWLEYHPVIDFFIHWRTSYIAIKYNNNLGKYSFNPARGNYGFVSKFLDVKRDRARAERLYTHTLN